MVGLADGKRPLNSTLCPPDLPLLIVPDATPMLANPVVHHNHPPPKLPLQRVTVTVQGIPSVSIQNNRLLVGSSQSSSTRSYTPVKLLGDGSFGTVWLCDWHGTLPPNTPFSPMQCGAGARAEWADMRLVAVKRMKKRWEGGWDECQKLKELEVCFLPSAFLSWSQSTL